VLAAGAQVQADLYLLSDKPVNTSEWRALLGVSGVGSSVQGAEGFTLEFQEKMTDSLYKDLSSDKNMSWVRRNSWLTYLTLNAPDGKVTYDMSVTPMGIVKVAAFGTKPMAIVDGTSTATRPLDAPTAPMGTAMTLLVLGIVLGAAIVGFAVLGMAFLQADENGFSVSIENDSDAPVILKQCDTYCTSFHEEERLLPNEKIPVNTVVDVPNWWRVYDRSGRTLG